jgi:hypothetical protein
VAAAGGAGWLLSMEATLPRLIFKIYFSSPL